MCVSETASFIQLRGSSSFLQEILSLQTLQKGTNSALSTLFLKLINLYLQTISFKSVLALNAKPLDLNHVTDSTEM